ncbi:MAG: hypothetical protein Q9174_003673 [Haloplaca sp. 1 TL-2023]
MSDKGEQKASGATAKYKQPETGYTGSRIKVLISINRVANHELSMEQSNFQHPLYQSAFLKQLDELKTNKKALEEPRTSLPSIFSYGKLLPGLILSCLPRSRLTSVIFRLSATRWSGSVRSPAICCSFTAASLQASKGIAEEEIPSSLGKESAKLEKKRKALRDTGETPRNGSRKRKKKKDESAETTDAPSQNAALYTTHIAVNINRSFTCNEPKKTFKRTDTHDAHSMGAGYQATNHGHIAVNPGDHDRVEKFQF